MDMLFIVTVLEKNTSECLKIKDICVRISTIENTHINKEGILKLIKGLEIRPIIRIVSIHKKKSIEEIYSNYKVLSQLAGDFLCNMWLYNIIWERSEF